jgi:hypothetical protein
LLIALAKHGLDGAESSVNELQEIIAEDPGNPLAVEVLAWIQSDCKASLERPEVESAT